MKLWKNIEVKGETTNHTSWKLLYIANCLSRRLTCLKLFLILVGNVKCSFEQWSLPIFNQNENFQDRIGERDPIFRIRLILYWSYWFLFSHQKSLELMCIIGLYTSGQYLLNKLSYGQTETGKWVMEELCFSKQELIQSIGLENQYIYQLKYHDFVTNDQTCWLWCYVKCFLWFFGHCSKA